MIEIVQGMYEAFGRGDIATVLDGLAEDVDWVAVSEAGSPDVPWYGRYRGIAEVPRFFKEIGSTVEVTAFRPLAYATNETDVMVALEWSFTVRATGRSVTASMQHWWRFADGKVVAVRTIEDSEATAAAFAR